MSQIIGLYEVESVYFLGLVTDFESDVLLWNYKIYYGC